MSSDSSLLQKNDQKIIVPLTRNGVPVDATQLVNATYKLYSFNKKQILINKTLGNSIVADGANLVLNISKEESEHLAGTYYHELTITDKQHGVNTVFQQDIRFKATKN